MYHQDLPFYACKTLKIKGQQYYLGQIVPLVEMKIPERRIEQLLKQRYIMQNYKEYEQSLIEKIRAEERAKIEAELKMTQPSVAPAKSKGRAKLKPDEDTIL